MNRPLVSPLQALAVVMLSGVSVAASAQTYSSPGSYSQPAYGQTSQVDYARVIRVDPVFNGYSTSTAQRCYERPTYVNGSNYGYGEADNYYSRENGYYDQYGNYRRNTAGTETGRTVATVIGGIVGAAVGSQVGGGSARYATSAIGSMVGGMAGRQIYEQSKRDNDRVGAVRVCDPVPVGNGQYAGNGSAAGYDVTYEYGGRTYTTRTNYHPGDRMRVRVDVRPE